jgi:hypothetical protein
MARGCWIASLASRETELLSVCFVAAISTTMIEKP